MEGWRQRRLGSMGTIWKKKKIKKRKKRKNERKALTLTGLMEGSISNSAAEYVLDGS
jgi:hypothetical protein